MKSNRVVRFCAFLPCSKPFSINQYQAHLRSTVYDGPRHRFCSHQCYWAMRKGQRLVLNDVQIELAKQMYESGASAPQITKELNLTCHSATVLETLRNIGVTIRRYTKPEKYRNREKNLPDEEIILLYQMGYSMRQLCTLYHVEHGTIKSHLLKHNIPLRGALPNGQRLIRSLDGHLVSSTPELRVDDWLYKHDLAHIYEPSLPFSKHWRADFFVRGSYIEIWGGSPRKTKYQQRKNEKIEAYKFHGLPLIQITLKQSLYDDELDNLLRPLLALQHHKLVS